jgi:hypothetical protein
MLVNIVEESITFDRERLSGFSLVAFIMCNYSSPFLALRRRWKKMGILRGYPAPRPGDCVPGHPLLKSYKVFLEKTLPFEKRSNDMVPNPYHHETDQKQMPAQLSRQHTSLMLYMAGKLAVFSIALGTGLKRFGQRMRQKHIPTKQRRPWSQSPHH